MIPLIAAAAMAGLGMAKNELIDKPATAQANKARAHANKYSPWTGVREQMVNQKDTFSEGLNGGMAGFGMAGGFGGMGGAAGAAGAAKGAEAVGGATSSSVSPTSTPSVSLGGSQAKVGSTAANFQPLPGSMSPKVAPASSPNMFSAPNMTPTSGRVSPYGALAETLGLRGNQSSLRGPGRY